MPWHRNTVSGKLLRAIVLLAASILTAGVLSCTRQEAVETLGRTLEGTARGACEQAGNCQNTCPDGSVAKGPLYTCP